MKFRHLLAKAVGDPKSPPFETTVVGHSSRVLDAAEVFVDLLLPDMTRLFGDAALAETWREALRYAAWLHDLGKGNDHFQRMMRKKGVRQGIRHETLGLVVIHDYLLPWLMERWVGLPIWFAGAVLATISGHHLKFPDKKDRSGMEVCFLGSHSDINALLRMGQQRFGLEPAPTMTDQSFQLGPFGIETRVAEIRRQLDTDDLREHRLFVACLKAALLCADAAGSAIPAEMELKAWLKGRLWTAMTREGLEDVAHQRLRGGRPRPFQETVQKASSNTVLLTAGCGSGKTAAAYLWAAEQAIGRRLFVCYPTTATASEGFAGYLQDPDFEAVLIHSRARVDYRLLGNMPEPTRSEKELRALQLEALETWPIPAVVCTAHTVFGLFQNVRRGLYAWPAIVRGTFVFDEAHAYSPKLFEHLLRFLETFPSVPVLLMTATLPDNRRKALETACRSRGGLVEVQGPKTREEAPRYTLHVSQEAETWDAMAKVIAKGGKVLWICNTVRRAIDVARRASEQMLPVEPFHSRYRYKDRLVRQRRVVDGFMPEAPGMLAVTTQVAEVSLDISADLLVTEYASVPSLIQRLGRLNRQEEVPSEAKPALFLRPENAQPYKKKEQEHDFWQHVEGWLAIVADGLPKSQRELAAAFLQAPVMEEAEADNFRCHWLDDPWRSESNKESLMEPGYTIELIREEDMGEGSAVELAIPMPFPRGRSWEKWATRGRYLVVPAGTINYDPVWGASYGQAMLDPWII